MLSRLLYNNIEPNTDSWVVTAGGTKYDRGHGISVDSSGNVYIVGYTDNSGNGNIILTSKYNTNGTLQWQRGLTTYVSNVPYGISVDSSGNVYIVGTDSVEGYYAAVTAKYNTDGALQWQRSLGSTAFYSYARRISVDSSGNVYIVGATLAQGANYKDLFIAKYNTNGILQWQRLLKDIYEDDSKGISVDSSGNVYIVGFASTYRTILIAKYNTNGTLQWQRKLDTIYDPNHHISVGPDGNVYIVSSMSTPNYGSEVFIAKYNTNGTLQWQRSLGNTSFKSYGKGISVAPDGNVYIVGSIYSVGYGYDVLIAKYNTDGALQWQRSLGSTRDDEGEGISVDSSGNVYIVGKTFTDSTYDNILIAKCGSPTGFIGNFTYKVTTLTDKAATLIDSANIFTDSVATFTDKVATMTDSAITLPSTIVKT